MIRGIGPLLFGIERIATHFRQVKQVALDVAHGIVSGFHAVVGFIGGVATTVWNALTWPFRKAWEFISGIFGKIKHGVQSVLGGIGKFIHGIPLVGGLFAHGGVVRPRYMAAGGPSGPDTVPAWLTPGEGVLTRAAMSRVGVSGLNALNSGQQGGAQNITITPGAVYLKLDSRVVAKAV